MNLGRPPRILLVHANAEWYGSDRSFTLLVEGLRRRGCEVTAVVPADGAVATRLRAADVPVVISDPGVPRFRSWTTRRLLRWALLDAPRSCWQMRRLARRADLVHLNTSTIFGALVGAVLAHRPVVLHLREHWPPDARWWRWYARWSRRVIDVVIAISTQLEDEARHAGFRRVALIHNGLRFGPPPAGHLRGLLDVGRINRWKGHEVLIEALGRLRERDLVVPLAVAGDAYPGEEPLVGRLRLRIDELGLGASTTLLGYVDNVPALYERSSIFVSPTIRPEPFGLALLDAMAAGLAPIATDAGGPRDLVRHGRTGLLVPMGDVDALADAIEELWLDPERARAMGAAAADDVRARFDIEVTVSAVEDVYQRILG
jgi:glycosyltransferase involved in cell wall biosynthesis